MSSWKAPSHVEISLSDYEDECTMTLRQSDIPKDVDAKFLKDGWFAQIFRPISLLCGYPITSRD